MQQARSTPFSSRKRRTLSAEESTFSAPRCDGSSIIASASRRTMDQGWTWRWMSKTRIDSALHHQSHANCALRTCILEFARGEKLGMDFVAVAFLETAFLEVLLRCRGQEIELADPARGEAINQLAHQEAPDSAAAMLRCYGDRADERRFLVCLRVPAADNLLSFARDDECLPVIIDAGHRQIVLHQQLFDSIDICCCGRTDDQLHTARITKGRARRAALLRIGTTSTQCSTPDGELRFKSPLSPYPRSLPRSLSLSMSLLEPPVRPRSLSISEAPLPGLGSSFQFVSKSLLPGSRFSMQTSVKVSARSRQPSYFKCNGGARQAQKS